VLFSRANTEELVGATAMVEQTDGKSLLPDKLWRLVWRDRENISPVYMLALLQSRATRQQLSKIASGTGGSMKNISQAKLMELRLPVAPTNLQRVFERYSNRASSIVESAEKATLRSEQAFQSLLAEVFGAET
jgi:type I restriction enzyme S subunit